MIIRLDSDQLDILLAEGEVDITMPDGQHITIVVEED